MTTSRDSILEFVRWAAEEGYPEMLTATMEVEAARRSVGCTYQYAEVVLRDHLETIRVLGPVIGSMRIRTLVEEYAPRCKNAPVPSPEAISSLFA
jgi:hypothetical protein